MIIIVKSKIWLIALSKVLRFKVLLGLAKRYAAFKKPTNNYSGKKYLSEIADEQPSMNKYYSKD